MCQALKKQNHSKDFFSDRLTCNRQCTGLQAQAAPTPAPAPAEKERSFKLDSFCSRYPDGTVKLRNPHIELMDQDILYHLALGSESHDLVSMFGDVKVEYTSRR